MFLLGTFAICLLSQASSKIDDELLWSRPFLFLNGEVCMSGTSTESGVQLSVSKFVCPLQAALLVFSRSSDLTIGATTLVNNLDSPSDERQRLGKHGCREQGAACGMSGYVFFLSSVCTAWCQRHRRGWRSPLPFLGRPRVVLWSYHHRSDE